MGKKKIGEIYNKPVVIGDKNLVTKNETHISELQGNSNNEGGGNDNIELTKGKKILSEYFYIDYNKLINEGTQEEIQIVDEVFNLYLSDNGTTSSFSNVIVKIEYDGEIAYIEDILSMSGYPDIASQMAFKKYQNVPPNIGSGFHMNKNHIYMNMINFIKVVLDIDIQNILDKYAITEEEFWKDAIITNDINEML